LAAFLLAAVTLLAFGAGARADERVKGDIDVTTDGGYLRLVFRFKQEVPASISLHFPILVITFKQPVDVAVDRLNASAPSYISAARADPDGSAVRIALAQPLKVHSIPAAEQLFVDLLPPSWSGVLPGLPQEVIEALARRAQEAERLLHRQQIAAKEAKPQSIRVRVASQPTFTRYVFDVPDGINVVPEQQHDGRLVLNFDRKIKWDLADAIATLPPSLKSIATKVDEDSATVDFVLNGNPKVRTFREGNGLAVDIGIDGAASPPQAVPGIAPPQTVPAGEGPPKKAESAPLPKISAAAPAPAAAPKLMEPKRAEPPAPKTLAAEAMAAKTAEPEPAAFEPAAPEAAKPAPAAPPPKVEAAKPPPTQPPPAPAAKAETAKLAPAKPAAKEAANADQPAPDPKATVKAELHQAGDNLRIEFPFAVPTPAAVFRRADTVWLVFDSAAKIDLAGLEAGPDKAIRSASFEHSKDGAAIVRLRLAKPRLVGVVDDGPAWIVNLGDSVSVPTQPLTVARSVLGKNSASIAIPFDAAREIHHISDAGDRLLVVTALAPARGFLKPQEFVELRALPSAQGVVLQPLADDVTAAIAPDKITVTRPQGLTLSPTAIGQQQLASAFRAVTFDTQIWGFDRQARFYPRQAELMQEAAMAPPGQRRHARLNLARFYLAQSMFTEAKGVLDFTLSQEHGGDDVTGTVLKAVTNVMLDRPQAALKDLSNPQIGNQLDAPIWRAMAYARQGQWAEAHDRFKQVDGELAALPIELQRLALRSALRAAVEVHDFGDAGRVLNELQTMGVPPDMAPSVAVLVGQLDEGLGRNEDALTNYRAAAASRDRPAAAQGRLREILLRYALGDMPRKDVVGQLESLTTVWRGDETETEGLKLLAHLYTEDGHYREAFHVMRTALLAHPNSDLTRKIEDEAAATFESLFLGGKANALPPVEALGLFYDYRELTPIGRRGDEMIRKLADRLVSVDLLEQAAELLQHQVDHRLQGAARAQVATRLATIYLMDRKPDRALAVLRSTRADGLSNELRDQRLLLEARALSEVGRHDLALEMIANIQGHEATRLRADILWAAKRWRQAAEQIELLYGDRWRELAPLSEAERIDVLRAAIGYALDDEAIGLQRFRDKYTAKMADSPDRHAFEVVTAPTGTQGAEFKNVAQTIAGVSTLDAFLGDMRKRYPDANPVSPEGAAEKAPAPAPTTPAKPSAAKAVPEKAADAKPTLDPAASPLPPMPPAGTPLKPDRTPTGSIDARWPEGVGR
jgi:tetratricopeptide (TPR) repeat protein